MLKKRIDQLLYASCGVVSALALFGIMWLTLVDVIGRKFFNHSIPGGLEITEIMLVCVIFCALPLVSWRGEHVVFDTFDGFIPKRLQRLQVRVVHVFSAFVFVGLAYLMTTKAMRFASYGDTTAYLLLPLQPVAWGMSAMMFVTGIVHLLLAILGEFGTAEHIGAHKPKAAGTPATDGANA